MFRPRLNFFCAMVMLVTTTYASAMMLSNRGMGQVLEFPYYTVNANQQTLLTIVNSTDVIKAVKVRFREAYDGRLVAAFNVYLSPFDVWTGTLFLDGSIVALGTRDNSCTVPKFDAALTSVGIPALAFSTASFVNANSDGGPVDLTRLQEGHFETFEMGTIPNDGDAFQQDIVHVQPAGVPPGCDKVVAAWDAGGVWAAHPSTNLLPPTGGLYGSSAIVNVGNGTFFAVTPAAIDGFSTAIQHTGPSSIAPDFDTATPGAAGKFEASVEAGGKLLNLSFSRSVDAVSSLFMATQLMNEYVALDGEQTDVVTTFPTKRFYVDPAISQLGSSQPFEYQFGETNIPITGSCVEANAVAFNRDEGAIAPSNCGFGLCEPGADYTFCHETTVIPIASSGSALSTGLSENFDARSLFGEGHFIFQLGEKGHSLKPVTAGDEIELLGLPAVGFVAENFVNRNVTPGVLSNYSATVPHRSVQNCRVDTTSGPQPCS